MVRGKPAANSEACERPAEHADEYEHGNDDGIQWESLPGRWIIRGGVRPICIQDAAIGENVRTCNANREVFTPTVATLVAQDLIRTFACWNTLGRSLPPGFPVNPSLNVARRAIAERQVSQRVKDRTGSIPSVRMSAIGLSIALPSVILIQSHRGP